MLIFFGPGIFVVGIVVFLLLALVGLAIHLNSKESRALDDAEYERWRQQRRHTQEKEEVFPYDS